MSSPFARLVLPDSPDMQRLAAQIAPLLRAGDTALLDGDIGAGKTTFARALIQTRLGRAEDVPSPTFTLVQTYAADEVEIWHCDLYRLTAPDEVMELGLSQAFETAICLIEWPDRLGSDAPPAALHCQFTAGADAHHLTLSGPAAWADRLAPVLDQALV
ncbi:tRNA (adenosine(37)-N6)-threonylcarbamoyltransferase complex ATPase subunit type 1 TsaE [Salipiger sp. IMCC34102]|uniref:tRNA (adenosine(37)-N6)-threonylcarbamoyltransferase complex ATPase subunit type 1 TsaE n=1 Tax=Salipiger sp. IMCC34102 TaxID=2510647 RepID=UPI00101C0D2D|nr:tRNA (adenosine(37)-N6)-threonylcarbamoyltransferase complex ATPase subunit type 1 TsaE [Salipiger sp. IMCC34102]RYH04235.1 tRNA (adenosine(37)-N6)-threonylcarbamoyltransferase complex ATPase subunit type 1 TsaE [Salipiger sp. IMCC34102]